MAKVFSELVEKARSLGVDESIITIAEQLEAHNPGLGVTVLRAENKTAEKKVDHAAQFVETVGAEAASAFYQAWLNVLEARDAYNETHGTTVVIDYNAMKQEPDVLQSGSGNPVAALFMVSRRKAGDAANPRSAAGERQTTPADVAALAQYLIGVTKTEPEVYMNVEGTDKRTGTLQADGVIVADEIANPDGTTTPSQTYADYRAWHAEVYPGGGSPSKIVGIVIPKQGPMSLEKAVRLAREAGNITRPQAEDGANDGEATDGEEEVEESDVPVTAGPPAATSNGRRRGK